MRKWKNGDTERAYQGEDLSGKRFGRLTVLGLDHFGRRKAWRKDAHCWISVREVFWKCLCDCGKESFVRTFALKEGKIQSCGCLRLERLSKRKRTHGKSQSMLYKRWQNMWTRCTNPKYQFWHHYGGRGITVCERWRSFQNFAEDMGATFQPGLSLDRKETNGNYTPENCRWATALTQTNNSRTNKIVKAFGKTQTAAQWAREAGINPYTFYSRLSHGIQPEAALTKGRLPPRKGTYLHQA